MIQESARCSTQGFCISISGEQFAYLRSLFRLRRRQNMPIEPGLNSGGSASPPIMPAAGRGSSTSQHIDSVAGLETSLTGLAYRVAIPACRHIARLLIRESYTQTSRSLRRFQSLFSARQFHFLGFSIGRFSRSRRQHVTSADKVIELVERVGGCARVSIRTS